jgi:predicted dehydrogenase
MTPAKTLGVGLYGHNGHQIHRHLAHHPRARLVAHAEFPADGVPENLRGDGSIRKAASLDELLRDERVQLVSLCSPRRGDQAGDAVRCLEAGKHVYAEKPSALSLRDLERILRAAEKAGRRFHEMAGTAFAQPWRELRRLVREGTVGEVIQVVAQKSYPYRDTRPGDEAVDGGITLQAGVHAARFVEHVAGVRIAKADCVETRMGSGRADQLRMASALLLQLENGGTGTITINYLNPPKFPTWGNESLRIFGTKGFVEAVDGGQRTRLVLKDRDVSPLPITEPEADYFDFVVDEILDGKPMPFSLEEELHPLRVLIRAKSAARLAK